MSCYEMLPQLIFERIINHDIEDIGLLAELSENIRDPNIRTLITSIIGDKYGHVRFLTLLLSQVTKNP